MTKRKSILSVKDLSLSFVNDRKRNEVLSNVSFDLYEGEILGIVGESGSGKSITALTIMQLQSKHAQVTSGSIVFQDKDEKVELIGAPEVTLCKLRGNEISMIFQEPMSSLNPSHRCGDQVLECLLIHNKMDKTDAVAMVKNLFRETELPDIDRIYNSYPHQLSGGQLQRVMIAMALINHPKIIIADEPTTALDVTVQKSIIQLIKRIASDYNSSIIFISHDLGVIAELCQRVVVMQKGEVKEIGTIHEVFHHPKDNYTKGLIACRPPMDKRFKRLPMVSDFLSQDEPQSFVKSLIQSEAEYLNHCKELENKEEYILKVKNLNKSYVKKRNFFGRAIDSHQALKNISFNMKDGEILGLVGESGCGKSTLGKCILRLTEPDSGYVWFDGHDVLSLSDKRMRILRKDFQIIFQDPYSSLNPRMKIGDAIREPMDIHHIGSTKAQRIERVVELLELVGLEADHMNRYPYQFSGGQRQRICISRTLSLNPKFIICDESVSALDVSVQAQVLNLLLDIKDKLKLSYLFISHNIGVVKFFCDNVLVMKQGEIVESGHVEQVITNPQHVYTKMLIDAVPK